jgi:hypothetical protein
MPQINLRNQRAEQDWDGSLKRGMYAKEIIEDATAALLNS